jgi:hypothetical protein
MANSIDTRLTELAERLEKAETELRKLKGTVTAHGVALKDKGK